jgi:regulatory protein
MVRFADDGGEHASAETERGLAPVIPLFGGGTTARVPELAPETEVVDAGTDAVWHPTWVSSRSDEYAPADDDSGEDRPAASELAEKLLLKRLRTRSLSVSEARSFLREHELDPASADLVLSRMIEFGYLDDTALAEQLVHTAVDRKGQGRQVIAQTLVKRGIPREIADAVLSTLPDDDLDRALEFARAKARSMSALDRDTALRRLAGQLARRGYPANVALTAAKQALDESGGSSGVRFR